MVTGQRNRIALFVLFALLFSIVGSLHHGTAQGADTEQVSYFRGNDLWLAGTNGSDQRLFLSDAPGYVRDRPVISPDSAWLAVTDRFSDEPISVWSLGDGSAVTMAGTSDCFPLEFGESGDRLIVLCIDPDGIRIVEADFNGADPVELDRVTGDTSAELAGVQDFRLTDRLILVEQWWDTDEGQGSLYTTAVLDADLNVAHSFEGVEFEGAPQALWADRLAPEGDAIIATICFEGCTYREESLYRDFLVDFDGNVLGQLSPEWMVRRHGANIAWPAVGRLPLIEATAAAPIEPSQPPDVPAAGPGADLTIPASNGDGWIAYVASEGSGGGVHVRRPDGSEDLLLTDEFPGGHFGAPTWSHDGAMLVFTGPTRTEPIFDGYRGIWIFRDGVSTLLPDTEDCRGGAFSADNTRLYFICQTARDRIATASDEELASNPDLAVLVSSALDGSDRRVEFAYSDQFDDEGFFDGEGAPLWPIGVDVNGADGSILLVLSGLWPGENGSTLVLLHFDADHQLIERVDSRGFGFVDLDGWLAADRNPYPRFLPGGLIGVVDICVEACGDRPQNIMIDGEGNELPFRAIAAGFHPYDLDTVHFSPDGQRVVHFGPNGIFALVVTEQDGSTIDFASGQFPAWQPATGVALETGVVETPDVELGAGWVAYVASEADGNGAVFLRRPDGSEPVRISPELPFWSFESPAWSNDGTMLAFNGPQLIGIDLDPYRGIWIFRDGELTQLPDTTTCVQPVFSADDERIYFHCWNIDEGTEEQLRSDPQFALLASSALDGSDRRTEIAWTDELDGEGFHDPSGSRYMLRSVDVNPEDGSLLLGFQGAGPDSTFSYYVLMHIDAEYRLIARYDNRDADTWEASNGWAIPELVPWFWFLPGGEIGFVETCPGECTYRLLDADGNEMPYQLVAQSYLFADETNVVLSPDGSQVLRRTWLPQFGLELAGEDGVVTYWAPGSQPVWQPVPVEISLP